jgi:hypothetical protein
MDAAALAYTFAKRRAESAGSVETAAPVKAGSQERFIRELAIKFKLRKRMIVRVLAKAGASDIRDANKEFLRGGTAQKNLKYLRKMKRKNRGVSVQKP